MNRREFRNREFISPEEVRECVASGPARFYACSFDGLDLRGVDLSDCIFDCGSSLVRAQLGVCTRAEFYTTDLRRVDLRRADLRWAYASNCPIDGIKMMGCQITVDCWFLSGCRAPEADGWRLAYFGTLIDTPVRNYLRTLVPKKFALLLRSQFSLGSRSRK